MGLTLRWWLILATYLLGAINFGVTRLRLNAPSQIYEALDPYAGLIGTLSFLGWCGVTGYVVRRYRRRAWPVLVGAPFAVFTALGVAWYILAVLFSGQL